MNINEWIKENTEWLVDEEDIQVVPVSELLELLKTHAIVPRKLTNHQAEYIFDAANDTDGDIRAMHQAMIKAAENE